MQLVSFNAFRTLQLPGVRYIKPDHYLQHLPEIRAADWLLFPEYWQIGALAFGVNPRLFPSLASYWLGHDKVEMTRAFTALAPAHVPFTLIEANSAEGAERVWDAMPLPFVAKIPRSSEGAGVFLIEDRAGWRDYCALSPVLYAQEYLPIDRDMRVVVIGTEVLGGYWRLQPEGGFHNTLARGGRNLSEPLPAAALELVSRLALGLGIDHGGFDIAWVNGHPYVLEFNRLFGNRGLGELNAELPRAMFDYLSARHAERDPPRPQAPERWRRAG